MPVKLGLNAKPMKACTSPGDGTKNQPPTAYTTHQDTPGQGRAGHPTQCCWDETLASGRCLSLSPSLSCSLSLAHCCGILESWLWIRSQRIAGLSAPAHLTQPAVTHRLSATPTRVKAHAPPRLQLCKVWHAKGSLLQLTRHLLRRNAHWQLGLWMPRPCGQRICHSMNGMSLYCK